MSQHLKHYIAFSLITILSTSTCFSKEIATFYQGELEKGSFLRQREYVVPECGNYEIYYNLSKAPELPTSEVEVLRWLLLEYSGFGFDVIFVQISGRKDNTGLRHVEALCVAKNEGSSTIMYYGEKFDDNFFNKLLELPKLNHLELFSFKMDDRIFPKVTKLENLEYLGLPFETKDEHLTYIGNLKKLTFINASGTKIKGKGFKYLSAFPKLRILDLRRTQLESGTLVGLRKCKSLETLLLSDTNIKDDDLKALNDLKMLKYITLNKTDIKDNGLKILSQLKNLRYVSLYDTPTTNSGRESFLRVHPNLILDVVQPHKSKDFLADREIIRAWFGHKPSQRHLAIEYSGKCRNRPKDLIESLKWILIFEGQKTKKNSIDVIDQSINVLTKEIIEQLDESQIDEAHKRARAYWYLQNKVDFSLEIERNKGLPLYQYTFPRM